MSAYITSLITISIVGGLICNLVSSFKEIKGIVNYFIGIIAVICLLSPIFAFISNISSLKVKVNDFFDSFASQDIIDNSNNLIINAGIESIEAGIKGSIINKFGFNENDVIIDLEADTTSIEAVSIKKITVTLTGKASWNDVDTVKSYLENIMGGNIVVIRK